MPFDKLQAKLITTVCIVLALPACGRDNDEQAHGGTDSDTEAMPELETTELVVTVRFGNDMMKTVTNSLHVWALRPKDGVETTCGELVGKLMDPYDLQLVRLADRVSAPPAEVVTIEAVEVGDAFVYVEGVTILGKAEFAGCATATLAQPTTSVEITLGAAGVFDCGDPTTENGAPCDDGSFCTIGETCSNGSCQGGTVRDCSILADPCNAATCSETDGCVTSSVPDDTPCNDGLLCTQSDSCQSGVCVGAPRDCEAEAEVCQVAIGCLEETGECLYTSASDLTPCDDGLYCTIDTVCISGTCWGDARECPGDDCNPGVCVEAERSCSTTFADTFTSCEDADDECTAQFGLCDGAGECDAPPANEGGTCDLRGEPGVCESGICVEPEDEEETDGGTDTGGDGGD